MIETIRHIYLGDAEEPLEIRPWPDAPGVMELRAPTVEARKWWGEISLTLDPEQARELAEALRASADDLEKTTKQLS